MFNRKILIMRGVPGCGYDYTALEIAETYNPTRRTHLIDTSEAIPYVRTHKRKSEDDDHRHIRLCEAEEFKELKTMMSHRIETIILCSPHPNYDYLETIIGYSRHRNYKVLFKESTDPLWVSSRLNLKQGRKEYNDISRLVTTFTTRQILYTATTIRNMLIRYDPDLKPDDLTPAPVRTYDDDH